MAQTNGNDKITNPYTQLTDGSYMYEAGLTKREYLSAMAMQGLMANPNFSDIENFEMGIAITEMSQFAVNAADALIAELNIQS